MKKPISFLAATVAVITIMASVGVFASQNTYSITPKAPKVTASLKPIIAKYRGQNYIGAMQDLEELVKKEKNNTYAKYYLALCYTRLGYRDEAKILYHEIVHKDDNLALAHYSQRALDCLDNPDDELCKPKEDISSAPEERTQSDDITLFLRSGQQIHPSAMDRITSERMKRRIEQEEYEKQQQEMQNGTDTQFKSDASDLMPTNEEIISALNTLSKIGINPYNNSFNPLAQANQYNFLGLAPMLNQTQNSEFLKMYLNSQLMQQNDLSNFGI